MRGVYEAGHRTRLHCSRCEVLLIDDDAGDQRPSSRVGNFANLAKMKRHLAMDCLPLHTACLRDLSIAYELVVGRIIPDKLDSRLDLEFGSASPVGSDIPSRPYVRTSRNS
jgi:hypothetical protein